MSLRKFFSSATTSRQDEDATSGDDPGPSKKHCTSAPPFGQQVLQEES